MFKVAQLGAGRMGSVHARSAAANPRLNLAYLIDPRPGGADDLAAETGARVTDFQTALNDPEVKGVIVASSTDAHLENTLQALRAGKAVFCEKPLDLGLDTLLAARGELENPAAPLFVAFNRRFDPHFQALRQKLMDGAVGRLESLLLVSHDPASPPAHFIPTSGGLFKDFTIHDFDMARWLLPEEPTEVFAWASCLVDPAIGSLGDVDTARIMLKTASGLLCVISNTRRSGCGYDQRVEAYGSGGVIKADNPRPDTLEVWSEDGARATALYPAFMSRYAQAYYNEMDHFADILAGTATPAAGFDASVRSLAMAEAAALSVRTGAPVKL